MMKDKAQRRKMKNEKFKARTIFKIFKDVRATFMTPIRRSNSILKTIALTIDEKTGAVFLLRGLSRIYGALARRIGTVPGTRGEGKGDNPPQNKWALSLFKGSVF